MFNSRIRRFGTVATAALLSGLLLAACSSSDGSAGAPASGGQVSQEVKDIVAQYADQPTAIVPSVPLTAKPEKKSVAFIVCADPTCAILDGFLKDAVSNFGWDYTSIDAPATDFGSAVQQAIDSGVDYIAGTGSDAATFKSAYDAMQNAGIPYFSCYASDTPAGEENNLYSNCYDLSAISSYTKAMSAWITNDSKGSANVAVVNIPEFPTLDAQVGEVTDHLKELCDGCKTTSLNVSLDDLASGGAPNAIVSYLQSNPDVNYLYLAFGNFEMGLGQALKSAGLDKVTVVGVQPQQPQVQSIVKGETTAWAALPQEYAMWSMADQMARVATDQWSLEDERKSATPPYYIIDSVENAKAVVDLKDGWPGPDGFKDQFKKLWNVS
jgi:ribose transport system substrate-binding protein